jgi:UDP-N-acetylmuramate--alanine ligase
MRIGIFFGGNSREREVSFAGGRTVYDNLNKALFEAVPIFVDSFGRLVLLDWKFLYKGSIRDFYPPVDFLKDSPHLFQVYAEHLGALNFEQQEAMLRELGKPLGFAELANHIDFAFLALHGKNGEDGRIQGMLEWYNIPYSGSGIAASALGMNKAIQKQMMADMGLAVPAWQQIDDTRWQQLSSAERQHFHQALLKQLGLPLVVKAANQGSSIGISILDRDDFSLFEQAVDRSFFRSRISRSSWLGMTRDAQLRFVRSFADIRSDIGLPVKAADGRLIYHPEDFLTYLDEYFSANTLDVVVEALDGESTVLFESFISGREFSCIVIQQEDGGAVALPPTGIVKGKELFDYRSKYLPGLSRKVTPIDLPDADIEAIREACEALFKAFHFDVYARIDGFYTEDGTIFLNDPNTTSGMMPSSFFFHQAAEIGLNPSQFLTYIIRTSLLRRKQSTSLRIVSEQLLSAMNDALAREQAAVQTRKRIAVIMGGYSSERHISVESGRNIYEKLSSSAAYEPGSIFLSGKAGDYQLHAIPINLHLKDNADDITEKIKNFKVHPIVLKVQEACKDITRLFAFSLIQQPEQLSFEQLAERFDGVFIALHGRPGEDGELQRQLEKVGLPYNGSSPEASAITINKFETNEILANAGLKVAKHMLVHEGEFASHEALADHILANFQLPVIAKPVDDGCSSAVKKLKNRDEVLAYAQLIYREQEELLPQAAAVLKLRLKEEFPQKSVFLVEEFIEKGDARFFLEVTGGMLSHYNNQGELVYEFFEPSESLAEGEVLSLEEKFLAGEGLNITPARYTDKPTDNAVVSAYVRAELEKAARVLGVEGYCRIDAFVKIYNLQHIEVYIIEINSLPGMTPATCIFHQCAINGYKPYDFIDRILNFGHQRLQKV